MQIIGTIDGTTELNIEPTTTELNLMNYIDYLNYNELPTVWERIEGTKCSADAKVILEHIIASTEYEQEALEAEYYLAYVSEGATLNEIAEATYCSQYDC